MSFEALYEILYKCVNVQLCLRTSKGENCRNFLYILQVVRMCPSADGHMCPSAHNTQWYEVVK